MTDQQGEKKRGRKQELPPCDLCRKPGAVWIIGWPHPINACEKCKQAKMGQQSLL